MSADELFRHFCNAAARTEFRRPILRIADLWPNLLAAVAPAERDRFWQDVAAMDAGERARFLSLLREWTKGREPHHAHGAYWLVLHQLAGLPIAGPLAPPAGFACWPELGAYRRDRFEGIHAVLVPASGPATRRAVRPIRVEFVSGDRSRKSWDYLPYRAQFDPAALKDVRRALTSLLGGMAFPGFAWSWALCGTALRLSATRVTTLAIASAALVAAISLYRSSPLPQFALAAHLRFLAVCGLVVLIVALAELLRAWRDALRLRSRLHSSLAVVVVGDERANSALRVDGSSFGLPLLLATLSALHEDDARQTGSELVAAGDRKLRSPLAWCTERLWQCSASMAFTGRLNPLGRVRPIQSLAAKVRACVSHPHIEKLFVPPGTRIGTKVRKLCTQGAGAPLSLCRLSSLLPPSIAVLRPPPLRVFAVASVLALGFAGLAVSSAEAWWLLLFRPPGPHILARATNFVRNTQGGQDGLYTAFAGAHDPGFRVCLDSHYWANRCESIPPRPSGRSHADLLLDRLPPESPSGRAGETGEMDEFDGILKVYHSMRFLGRSLREVVVEEMPLEELSARF